MFAELIRVLPVAILICLAPGYFWARLLCAAGDFPSRLAYSAALSVALVPAVALAQIRILGTGLSFPIALVSPLVVFTAGLGAYLVLGPPKEDKGHLLGRPAPPGALVLVMVLLAFVAALAELLDLVPGFVAWPLALLLILSGITTHLLTTPHATGGDGAPGTVSPSREAPEDLEEADKPLVRYALLSGVVVLVLARGYLGPVFQDWPFFRGDDQYQHTVMTEMIIAGGSNSSFMLYPPGIHLFMAELTHLSGVEPLEIFATLIPALLVLPTLAIYALGRYLWGWRYGFAAAAFYGLLSGGSYWYLEHGRYPNIIAAQFLMVLALATLFRLYNSPSWRSGLLLALLGSSVVLYHQVGSFYLALLLLVTGALFLPYALLRERRRGLSLLASFGLLGVLSVLFAWNTYDLPSLIERLLGDGETGRGSEAVAMAFGTKPPESIGSIIEMTSQPLLWLGLLGAFFLLAGRERRAGAPDALARGVLISWTVLMAAGSLTSASGFPDRFQRDLGVPLALLGALAFVTILRSVVVQRRKASVVVAALTVLVVATVVDLRAMKEVVRAADSSEQLTMSPQLDAAGEWLKSNNDGGNIVVSPYTNLLPTRGVLAMGGYTGVQSYDLPRIERARDIPPGGPEPLLDALWMLENPAGEKTRRLIERYDIRYVVKSKIYPVTDWPAFKEREDLYRTVFENNAVVIFEPRQV